jgi:hypothetical protein
MSWNYRLIRKKLKGAESKWFGKYMFNVHEVYYDKDGEIIECTENPVSPIANSKKGFVDALKMMMRDITKYPVLDNSILEKELKKKNPCYEKAEVKDEEV